MMSDHSRSHDEVAVRAALATALSLLALPEEAASAPEILRLYAASGIEEEAFSVVLVDTAALLAERHAAAPVSEVWLSYRSALTEEIAAVQNAARSARQTERHAPESTAKAPRPAPSMFPMAPPQPDPDWVPENAWEALKEHLKTGMLKSVWDTVFAPCVVVAKDPDGTLVVQTPDGLTAERLTRTPGPAVTYGLRILEKQGQIPPDTRFRFIPAGTTAAPPAGS